jgi:hypothetical protein
MIGVTMLNQSEFRAQVTELVETMLAEGGIGPFPEECEWPTVVILFHDQDGPDEWEPAGMRLYDMKTSLPEFDTQFPHEMEDAAAHFANGEFCVVALLHGVHHGGGTRAPYPFYFPRPS